MNRRAMLKSLSVVPVAIPLAAQSALTAKAAVATSKITLDLTPASRLIGARVAAMHDALRAQAYAAMNFFHCLRGGDAAVLWQMHEHDLFDLGT